MRGIVGIGLVAVALGVGGGCAATTPRSVRGGFAEAERLLYPYTVARTVDGHRRLGQVIRRASDPDVRAAACYHYLRSSLDVAALAFYPIAAADGRPEISRHYAAADCTTGRRPAARAQPDSSGRAAANHVGCSRGSRHAAAHGLPGGP